MFQVGYETGRATCRRKRWIRDYNKSSSQKGYTHLATSYERKKKDVCGGMVNKIIPGWFFAKKSKLKWKRSKPSIVRLFGHRHNDSKKNGKTETPCAELD